jgi:thiamine biosynthesis lipoprotein
VTPAFEHEHRFDCFGTEVRLLIGVPVTPDAPAQPVAALRIEALLRDMHRRLTRFDPESELCRLNGDPAERVPISPTLALALRAGLWAAEQTNGLVDPTLTLELERAGYARSRRGLTSAPLAEALAAAPPRRPARPLAVASWKRFRVDGGRGEVRRPPGVRFDTGGSGKGLAADLCASRLAGHASFVVDVGGDARIGGRVHVERVVQVAHPLADEPALVFTMVSGAVATSGIDNRLWRREGGFGHHLLDPSTGEPAWTGVIQATAIAESALEAETLAKAALLSGPEAGLRILAPGGGLLVLDGGEVVKAGAIADASLAREPLAA